jgi:adenylate cyclase class IV
MIEVEGKFVLNTTAWPRLKEHLATMQFMQHVRNRDIYYDTAAFDLLRQAVFVRVRNHLRLEFKFNELTAPSHLQSTEQTFTLQPAVEQVHAMNALFSRFLPQWYPADTVEEALHSNSLIELARIENSRMQYTHDDLVICVDQVEGLGNFVEIELQCEEGSDTSQAQARVQRLAADMAIQRVRMGYVELWLQKHHPYAYRLGKYHE